MADGYPKKLYLTKDQRLRVYDEEEERIALSKGFHRIEDVMGWFDPSKPVNISEPPKFSEPEITEPVKYTGDDVVQHSPHAHRTPDTEADLIHRFEAINRNNNRKAKKKDGTDTKWFKDFKDTFGGDLNEQIHGN